MKKWIKNLLKTAAAGVMALTMASTAFAAGWKLDQGTGLWQYDLGNGQHYAAASETPRWEWLDGNADGIAECYAFNQAGWMYTGGTTPDGYEVNADGAWTVNGLVQTMAVAAGYSGTAGMTAQNQTVPDIGEKNILIAYFSHTGTTEEAAKQIQQVTGGDLFELQPVQAYPDSYQAAVDAARRERDSQARPALRSQVEPMAEYDIILVGYPIWWHTTPMVINTFLESYDLSGKIILPFCTSGGSDIEESIDAVRASSGNGTVGTGLTANGVTTEEIQAWLQANGI